MGWDFGHGETRADRIRDLTKAWESETASYTTLRHCAKGNILWYVVEKTDKATGATSRAIGCSILGAMKGVGWGSKDMSEEMGPCYYSVPLSYLDMVPEPEGKYAAGWREKVRKYHAARGKPLRIGETVTLFGCSINEVVIEKLRPLMGRAVGGMLYRIPRRMLVPADLR